MPRDYVEQMRAEIQSLDGQIAELQNRRHLLSQAYAILDPDADWGRPSAAKPSGAAPPVNAVEALSARNRRARRRDRE